CQTLTDLKVRFRVFQQSSLSGTPVFNQVASVNSQGDALIVLTGLNSLAVGSYTVRAAVEPLACWLTASADACLTADYGSTDRRVTGGGWIPTLSGNRKANFGFTVGFNKNGTLKGNSIYMVRGDDGYNYLVKSTSWNTVICPSSRAAICSSPEADTRPAWSSRRSIRTLKWSCPPSATARSWLTSATATCAVRASATSTRSA